MTELTKEQLDFLASQKIPMSWMFDATGLGAAEYKRQMESVEKYFAYGVTPCTKAAHTLRSRAGRCIQCKTAEIAFTMRHFQTADVYLAGSVRAELIKVGSAKDPNKRLATLNSLSYGGAKDWQMLCHVTCKNAGAVELKIHEGLQRFFHQTHYIKRGKVQNCRECFACSYDLARAQLNGALIGGEFAEIIEAPAAISGYNFRVAL